MRVSQEALARMEAKHDATNARRTQQDESIQQDLRAIQALA
ncbi:hypothetical protein PF008_g23515 [Phytophthora fragariae]|uniref:Uncharacterized protein n=1 Tax=Phytophthora fragariae TaxID=53985 RepID=A0A6G0QQQ5_9STRA|nr:hypothetical protein PF008_g23515 [Phytophthora fragariae]